ncbi:hypothetical protein AVEN_126674-1 [Araneus ventricosus]|uniref:Uncharacterized protein n=1 Tax=Araneus ventricosus TaxID=182803 RepID=A0A4Y2SPT8_ARAVE|nr:hypothetical protein AVEN_66368-1 [Araneus ventricosus]GBN89189.1 hypothetical protein AVEN_126674-1 [Araneus ventricosus]
MASEPAPSCPNFHSKPAGIRLTSTDVACNMTIWPFSRWIFFEIGSPTRDPPVIRPRLPRDHRGFIKRFKIDGNKKFYSKIKNTYCDVNGSNTKEMDGTNIYSN